ncbi:MAG: 30S ribosomal protein S17 [Anaerolineaceae bacterium]|nr:30S ribosomal protein S17 [Anaerolineaceae bacterium]
MNTRRRLTGVVASNKMMKTVVVEVSRTYRHPLYQKVIHKTKRFQVHDEMNCQVGDKVQIVESKPISKYKRWIVEKKINTLKSTQEVPTAGEV